MCWNQPPGTFSDDSSMMYCTVESLINTGFDINDLADKYIKWYKDGYWGAHHKLFDIGGATRSSLERILDGAKPEHSGAIFEEDNGNGSLMRILPFIFLLSNEKDINARFRIIKTASSITHAHFRSVFSCFVFVEFGINLLKLGNKFNAYSNTQKEIQRFINENSFNPSETKRFARITENNIWEYDINQISSSGYVLDSLESSLWCFFTTDNFKDSVLKAVNLGGDTDTTAAITGGLSGLFYGFEFIPEKWVNNLARANDIEKLAEKFMLMIQKNETI
jgi:ADP-ribosylglycohydrolase